MATTTLEPFEPLNRGRPPSVRETGIASAEIVTVENETSDQADELQPQHRPLSFALSTSVVGTNATVTSQPVPVSRNIRATSLAIRRKPLPPTASPLVTRHLSRDYQEIAPLAPLSKPETRFSRSYSVDSPTLYEFPASAQPPIGSLNGLASSYNYSPLSSQP
jgi:hypothetical protein